MVGGVLVAVAVAVVARPWSGGPVAGDDVVVSAPRGSARTAELHLDARAAQVRVEGGAPAAVLLDARGVGDGRTASHERSGDVHDVRVTGAEAVVRLAADVTWTLRLTVGADDARVDLSALGLDSFTLAGGAQTVELSLPAPGGTASGELRAGADSLTIHLPAGVGARVAVAAGVGTAVVDGARTEGVGQGAELTTADDSSDHWALTLAAGVGTLTLP